jgi:hypothetical protein
MEALAKLVYEDQLAQQALKGRMATLEALVPWDTLVPMVPQVTQESWVKLVPKERLVLEGPLVLLDTRDQKVTLVTMERPEQLDPLVTLE